MFGGGTGSMNIILKNNRNLLKKHRKSFKELSELSSNKEVSPKVEYNLPKVSPQTVKLIGERIQRENKELFYKRLVVFGLLVSIIAGSLMYYLG